VSEDTPLQGAGKIKILGMLMDMEDKVENSKGIVLRRDGSNTTLHIFMSGHVESECTGEVGASMPG
jgi:hypothetical protein